MFKVLIICVFSLSLDELVEDIPGMVGCMRGLVYNEKGYALSDLIDSRYCLFICLSACFTVQLTLFSSCIGLTNSAVIQH